jgi:hypothetical protein
MSDFKCFADSDFEVLLSLMREADGWELCSEVPVKVWRRPDKKNKVWKVRALFFLLFSHKTRL